MSSRDWDATTYDRVSEPQLAWAREQLERLELSGDESVLDAGCGSGRVTAELAQRVPHGHVYAVDAAPSMVEHARQALGERATVLCQDLVELELPEPVDAVFSNATFHWVHDHARPVHGAAAQYEARRPPGRAMRRTRQHRRLPRRRRLGRGGGAVRPLLRRMAAAVELRRGRGNLRAAGAGRVQRRGVLAGARRRRRWPSRGRSWRPCVWCATSTRCPRVCAGRSSIACSRASGSRWSWNTFGST